MSALQEQLLSLSHQIEKAQEMIHLESLKKTWKELQQRMEDPHFWDDTEQAQKISREAADLQRQWQSWEEIGNSVNELQDFVELAEGEEAEEVLKEAADQFNLLEEKYKRLELETLFQGDYDVNNALISLHAGAGGTDAQDWAEMVARMLMRFAEKKEWKVSVLDQSMGEEAGIKSMTFSVEGRFAYGYLKAEAGVHRLVRISPFDAEGMRHTSFALVEVIPELDNVHAEQIDLNPKDLRIDSYASSGAGGQSVNTTNSAIRVTHLPTNTVVTCQNERSQQQNKETALKVLKARLFKRLQEEHKEKLEELKGEHQSAEWGSQIRSYVLHPYKLVKDHRSNFEVRETDTILDGDIESMIESVLRNQIKEQE